MTPDHLTPGTRRAAVPRCGLRLRDLPGEEAEAGQGVRGGDARRPGELLHQVAWWQGP